MVHDRMLWMQSYSYTAGEGCEVVVSISNNWDSDVNMVITSFKSRSISVDRDCSSTVSMRGFSIVQ